MNAITTITGRGIPLLLDDIDTDRIIPARYLRCVTFDGLGEHVFEDDRQQKSDHPFNLPQYRGASVLIAGRNFGCGSSREHAPQALVRWGIKAIVGESFAEIFFGNCTQNGIPCVTAAAADLAAIAAVLAADPSSVVTVDLQAKRVSAGKLSFGCQMQEGARQSLVTGNWDFLGQLLDGSKQIADTATRLPYLSGFAKV